MTATKTTPAHKLTVWAPKVPGAQATIVGRCDTMAEAHAITAQYAHRRDLTRQDVYIVRVATGKIISRDGPAR
jgi:hypothetical protein